MTISILLYFIGLLVILAECSPQSQDYFHSPLNKYVGDNNYSKLFEQVQQKGDLIGILFTNKHCKQCSSIQTELIQIVERASIEENVSIYRSQLSINQEMQEQFHIKRYPMIHFVLPVKVQRQYSHGEEKSDPFQMIHPQIFLNWQIVTKENTIRMIKKLKYYLNKTTNIDCFFDKIIVRQKFYTEDHRILSKRFGILNFLHQDLPLIVFNDQNQFKQTLKLDGLDESFIRTCDYYSSLFKECSSFNENIKTGSFQFDDIEHYSLTEFNENNYRNRIGRYEYHFVAVLDSIFERGESMKYIKILQKIMRKKEMQRVNIFWMQAQINKDKLTHLGFDINAHPPLLALFDLRDSNKKTFGSKQGEQFNQASLFNFIKSIKRVKDENLLNQQKIYLNQEHLKYSLKRLGLQKKIKFEESNAVSLMLSLKKKNQFILWLPYADVNSLDDRELWYEQLLNFNYFIKRILRLSADKYIERYVMLGGNKVELVDSGVSFSLIDKSMFKIEEISREVIDKLREKYHLPQYFWVNEDKYLQYLEEKWEKEMQPSFETVFIEI